MSNRYTRLMAALCVGGAVCLPVFAAEETEAPQYTIKDVMKKGMNPKTGLLKKVSAGDATDAEKKQLHDMFVALGKNEPPQGDPTSWKKFTTALAKAGKAAVDGEAEAAAMLKKAADCKGCHSEHKPA